MKMLIAFASMLTLVVPTLASADPAPPDITLTGHNRAVVSVAFAPDGSRLASVDQDGVIKIWDVAAKKELASIEITVSSINHVQFTPDGKTLLALGATSLAAIDVASAKQKMPIAVANLDSGPTAFDIAPDSKTAVVVGQGTLRFYDLATATLKAGYDVHAGHAIAAVAFSPDGSKVATASDDRTALVIDAATGKIETTLSLDGPGTTVLFSSDGKRIITDNANCTIRSTPIAGGDGNLLSDKIVPRSMLMSHDGKTLVIGGAGNAPRFMSVDNGTIADSAYASDDDVFSAALSPDGAYLAGGSAGGSIFLWKTSR